MHLYLEIAGDQIEGGRDYQEDAFLITYVDEPGGEPRSTALLVMADGMGGHAAGNIASQLVVNTFNRMFTSKFGSDDVSSILRAALDKSNDGLAGAVKETPGLEGMGCTMVTGAISNGKMWWVSVGDSHLYLVRDGKLSKLNEDHSYGGYLDRMEAAGTPVEPDPGLARNMLRSAVMGEEIPDIDCPTEPFGLKPGDRVIISSDGLDTLDDSRILEVAKSVATPKECVGALLQAVIDAAKPRQDNTTVLCCDVIKQEEAAPPEPVAAGADTGYESKEPSNLGPMFAKLAVALVVLGGIAAAALFVDWKAILEQGKEEVAQVVEEPAAPAVEPDAAAEDEAPAADIAAETTEQVAAAEPEPVVEEPATPVPAEPTGTFRDRLRSGGTGPQMVSLPGGTFKMGSNEGSAQPSMRPQHDVSVRPFAIATHELTFAEYERFARATNRAIPPADGVDKRTFPVFGVSWEDALAYTQWLSRETGHRYALPTEAQWEYAASAGRNAPYWWGYDAPRNRAHCFGCTPGLHPRMPIQVGYFEPSPYGLYDTIGNVAEWVRDCWHANYRGAPGDGGVWEGGDCSVRVIRGGHYASPNPGAQSRDSRPPGRGYPDVGIRVVRND